MYNVVNSIITDRKMYRCIFKVSFYFRGSLYEINVLSKLFLQIEVSILRTNSDFRSRSFDLFPPTPYTAYAPHYDMSGS